MSGVDDDRGRRVDRRIFETLDQLERLLNDLPDHPKGCECIGLFLRLRRTVTLVLKVGPDQSGDVTDEPD